MAISEDIRTKRLLITPFKRRHLTEHYVSWLNDSKLMCYSEQRHRVHTIESCLKYMHSFEGTPNYFWAIEEMEEGMGHIGNVNAFVNTANLLADIGILIGDSRARKKGYGTETYIGVCSYLFNKAGMRKLTSGTLSANLPMIKLMQRIGMVEDGTRKNHCIVDGREEDIIHMALFKDSWTALSTDSSLYRKYMPQDK